MYCIVLPGPTRDHNLLHWGPFGPPLARLPQWQGSVYTAHPRAAIEASQASWNSTSSFLVPRGTGQPHKLKEQHRDVNEEDGVKHGMKGCRGATRRPRRRQHPCDFRMCRDETRQGRTRSPLAAGRNQTKPDEGDDEGKDEAEGESRRRRPRQEEEEENQRNLMPSCHRQIRLDGKADEEAKY